MREIRASETFELRIQVGKIPSLQQRVVAEVHAGHDVLRAEGDLLGLCEKIIDTAIEHQTSYFFYRNFIFRYELGGVQNVEREFVGKLLIEELEAQFPFG